MKPNQLIEKTLKTLRKIIPTSLFKLFQPIYHFLLAFISALVYNNPSREIKVVAVTGTKGKTSVTEMIEKILSKAGYKTALLNTYQFKIGDEHERNMFKMSTPGRGFVQRFIRRAVDNECDWVIMELTSQAVLLNRHRFLELDALVFTNISPEHIEAHGSFEHYLEAKLKLADLLKNSSKEEKMLVTNMDDEHGELFRKRAQVTTHTYTLEDAKPYICRDDESFFTFKKTHITSHLPGLFNIYNMLAAATFAHAQGVEIKHIKEGLESIETIRGRLEVIPTEKKIEVYVDYAHTPDSLEKVYETFDQRYIIGVLGNTGGGRDTWKRSVMAEIAEEYCSHIIFTNEDPYDEDPRSIVQEMYDAISSSKKAEIVLDRREAIREALRIAQKNKEKKPVVLITGKGTDPYIMVQNGEKIPWDDASVVKEELEKLK